MPKAIKSCINWLDSSSDATTKKPFRDENEPAAHYIDYGTICNAIIEGYITLIPENATFLLRKL